MSLGPPGAQLDPEQAENFEDIEKQFAVKVVQHMETYWSILERKRGSELRLTKFDDEIFEHLKKDFPEFDPAETLKEDEMKSKEGKERWRNFVNAYEKKIDDFNFGAMVRANPKWEYGEKETIFVVRMQFYAIEIARCVNRGCFWLKDAQSLTTTRNRAGLNDWIFEKAHSDATKS